MKTVLQHLADRHFDTRLHTAWVDENERVATFPLWNLSGQMVGYQQYRPEGIKKKFNHPKEGRYFTYRERQNVGFWGMESWNNSNVLFVTEGVFDAARLTSRGVAAVATCSNDLSPPSRRWMWAVCMSRPVVMVCDGDQGGVWLTQYGNVAHVMPAGMDMGDVDDQYVTDFLRRYNYGKRIVRKRVR